MPPSITTITWNVLLFLDVFALIVSVRAYRANKSRALFFLLCACISYGIARSAWFIFWTIKYLFSLSVGPSDQPAVPWQFYTQRGFDTLFLIFMILALISFIRERQTDATSRI
jgi:hypothetical protein